MWLPQVPSDVVLCIVLLLEHVPLVCYVRESVCVYDNVGICDRVLYYDYWRDKRKNTYYVYIVCVIVNVLYLLLLLLLYCYVLFITMCVYVCSMCHSA